ncbi:hypothetical protein, partial [Prevotella sp. DNF00663]|uniref:hypothetical protein n=1 Tax=Prevotella sp. DNF00663 TaxID=1384078 RepID=UPI001E55EA69
VKLHNLIFRLYLFRKIPHSSLLTHNSSATAGAWQGNCPASSAILRSLNSNAASTLQSDIGQVNE